MNKSIILIVTFLGLLLIQSLSAASSNQAQERTAQAQKQMDEMRKRQQQWRTEHPAGKPGFRGPVGKYQAVRLSEGKVFILDTAAGNFWLWDAKGGKEPQYQGQIPEIKK